MPTKTKPRPRVSRKNLAHRDAQLGIFGEIAEFLATRPSREKLLNYHPSTKIQRRASELLDKNREGELTHEDREELNEFSQAELFMRMLKAKVRGANAP